MTKITKLAVAILFTFTALSTTASADWWDGWNNGSGVKPNEKSITKQYKKSHTKKKRINKKTVPGIGDETYKDINKKFVEGIGEATFKVR